MCAFFVPQLVTDRTPPPPPLENFLDPPLVAIHATNTTILEPIYFLIHPKSEITLSFDFLINFDYFLQKILVILSIQFPLKAKNEEKDGYNT